MKKLIFCCLCIFALMACGERNAIIGRWAMTIDQTDETFIKMLDDTIVTPELRFGYDTVYMEVRTDGIITRSECIGVYTINGNMIKVIDRYGKEQEYTFALKDDTVFFSDKNSPTTFRLRKVKEED